MQKWDIKYLISVLVICVLLLIQKISKINMFDGQSIKKRSD